MRVIWLIGNFGDCAGFNVLLLSDVIFLCDLLDMIVVDADYLIY